MNTASAEAGDYDLIIIGGGITGAGIFREATRSGARVLLLERADFASGTSSASSKLVHGGLRYLKSGQWRLTLESVRERERLLREAPGLVEPLGFAMPAFRGQPPHPWLLRAGLRGYDWMARRRTSRWLPAGQDQGLVPGLREDGRLGIAYYEDARTDDARLTLRLILAGIADGGEARHYQPVSDLHREHGRVAGVVIEEAGQPRVLRSRMVVNATGVGAAAFGDGAPVLRPLRGSHLVFRRSQLPLTLALSWLHPADRRPVFAFPWEGAVLYGTTDLDHDGDPWRASMSRAEADYLIAGLAEVLPGHGLRAGDAIAAYAGVRPVVAGDGAVRPSDESRESAMWREPGLIGITGGKLTTFRVTARRVLRAAAEEHAVLAPVSTALPLFGDDTAGGRIGGRYGARAAARMTLGEQLGDTPYHAGELIWSAAHEPVRHLDDLLLRRTRLGLVADGGGIDLLAGLQAPCCEALGWGAPRWRDELARYRALWRAQHDPAVLP